MSDSRKIVFANDYYYHIFNRGVERRITFSTKRDYARAIDLLYFYNFVDIPVRYSRYQVLPSDIQSNHSQAMIHSGNLVEIISYCLMPNHFHLLLKQKVDRGIITFLANFTNAYTKYFNTKEDRPGALFQGRFKGVFVETDEQMLHLTRYIHLNPIIASLVTYKTLNQYPWSSYPAYINKANDKLINQDTLSMIRKFIPDYPAFVEDQISYAKELDKIKHLLLD